MVKIDTKDRKLLYYLSRDARMSNTQLSKAVGLSKNAVKYRIERLKKEGIILKFASVINVGSLKLDTVTLLLKFNEDIYEKKEIIDYFRNHGFVNWAITLSGQWDLFVEFMFWSLPHFEKTLNGVLKRFRGTLSTYKMLFSRYPLRSEHLVSDFYEDLKMEEVPQKPRVRMRYNTDETDRKILKVLNEDSSLPYLQIAQKLGLTIDIVRYRIKNLINKGIIIKFFAEVSLPKLGYTEYMCTLKLKNLSQEKLDSIKRRIGTDGNVTYAFVDLTELNLVFVCAFKDPSGIDHLSRHLRKEYSDIIEEQDYLIIKEQLLFNLFPRGLVASSDDVIGNID